MTVQREDNTTIAGLVSILIIIIGVWRLPAPNMQEYIAASFRIGCILLLISVIWKYCNKWVSMMLLLSILSQLYLATFSYLTITDANLMQYLSSVDGLLSYQNLLLGVLWYFLIVCFVENTEWADNWIMTAIMILAFVYLFFVILQKLNLDPFHVKKNGDSTVVGMLTNSNELSAFFALCLSVFLRKKIYWPFISLLLLGIVFSKSCSGLVGIIVGLMVFIGLSFNFWVLLICGIACIAVSLLYVNFIDAPTYIQRFTVWRELLKYYWEQSWLRGFGIGGLKWVTLEYERFRKIDSNGTLWWYTANNEFVHGLCENGILFIPVIIGYLLNIFKRVNKDLPIIPIVGLSVIIIVSCFTYIFHNGVNAMIAITLLALLERQLRRKEMGYEMQISFN